MNRFFGKILNSDVAKSILSISSGTALAQIIGVLSLPIISRLYTAEVIGANALFFNIGNIFSTILCLMFPLAIALARTKNEARCLVFISLILCAFGTVVVFFVTFLFSNYLNKSSGFDNELIWNLYMVLFVLFSSLGTMISQLMVREQDFKIIGSSAWKQALFVNVLKVANGVVGASYLVFYFITSITGLIRLVVSKGFIKKIFSNGYFDCNLVRPQVLFRVAKKYSDFPIYRMPQALIFSFSQAMPVLFISYFSNDKYAGFFTLAMTALSLPANLIGSAVAQVYYRRFVEVKQSGHDIAQEVIIVTRNMAIFGSFGFLGFALFGKNIFYFVFGVNWIEAGVFAQILSMLAFTDFISRPSATAIPVLRNQKLLLGYESFSLLFRVFLMYLVWLLLESVIYVVMAYSIIGCVFNLLLIKKVCFR